MRFHSDSYRDSKLISHQGVVFAFASRATVAAPTTFQIGYTFLALRPENPNDDDSWRDFVVLEFPRELRPVGMGLIGIDFGSAEIPVADAVFQVLSDGLYVYIFRQSTKGTIYMDRFIFDQASGRLINAPDVRYRRSRNPDIPASRKDSFGYTDMEGNNFVEPTTELSFVQNVSHGRFAVLILPTELQDTERWQIFAVNSSTGKLDSYNVLRAQDGTFDLTGAIDEHYTVPPQTSFTIAVPSQAALFGIAAGPAAALYMCGERLKDEYGRFQVLKKEARVMVAIPTLPSGRIVILDFGVGKDGQLPHMTGTQDLRFGTPEPIHTSLSFDGSTGVFATLPRLVNPPPPETAATVEVAARITAFGPGSDRILSSAPSETLPLALTLEAGQPQFTVWKDGVPHSAKGPPLELQTWSHLAGTWDGTTAKVYVNGQPYQDPGNPPAASSLESGYLLGGAAGFTGQVATLRIWNSALNRAHILDHIGKSSDQWAREPEDTNPIAFSRQLAGYWPMDAPLDELRLTTVPNASVAMPLGNGLLGGACWSPECPPLVNTRVIELDANALTMSTALLANACALDAPSLLVGSDGLIHLYYRDAVTNVFAVARMDTLTGRAHYALSWSTPAKQSGMARLIARDTGVAMNYDGKAFNLPPVEVADDNAGDLGRCTLTLRNIRGWEELWPKVPRALESFLAVVNGDAIQSQDPAHDADAATRGLVTYDYNSVTAHGYRAVAAISPQPKAGTGSAIFTAYPDTRPDDGGVAQVQNTSGAPSTPALVRAGLDCRWITALPRAALTLDGSHEPEVIKILAADQVTGHGGDLNLDTDMSIEVWLNPTALATEPRCTVLIFNNPSASVAFALGLDGQGKPFVANAQVASIATAAALPVGQWSHVAATYDTDYGIQFSGQRYLDAGKRVELVTGDAITVEAWVRLDRLEGNQTIVSKTGPGDLASWSLRVDAGGKPVFDVITVVGFGTAVSSVSASETLEAGKWHHVAGVYDVVFTREVAAEFAWTGVKKDNAYISMPKLTNPPMNSVTVEAWVRRLDAVAPRVPDWATSQTIFSGFYDVGKCDFSLSLDDNAPRFVVFSEVHSGSAEDSVPLPPGQWVHLAATFDDASGTGALYVDGILKQTLATRVLSPPSSPRPVQDNPYSAGGLWDGTTLNGVMNELRLWNRALSIEEIRQNMKRRLTGSEQGLVGYWPLNDRFGTAAIDLAGMSNGTLLNGACFVSVDKGAFIHKLVVDGARVVSKKVVDPPHTAEQARLRMGSADFRDYLRGAIDDVRVWKVGRLDWEIADFQKTHPPADSVGLVGYWPFAEGQGAATADAKGESDAVLLDGSVRLSPGDVASMWIPTYFKAGWTLFVNGVEVSGAADVVPAFGTAQLTLGGLVDGASLKSCFSGAISELRLWGMQRTAEEIRDTLYRPLIGGEQGLIGYWPISEGSGNIVGDRTGRGNNGARAGSGLPKWSTATMPVGDEGPQVRVVPGAVSLPQVQTVDATPGAAEYSDLQTNAAGDRVGVLKRCYGWIQGTALNLATGYRVGDLDVQYVGQIQTRPTLIGYIEGAPPLPLENLTMENSDSPYNYLAASTVELLETGETALVYTASRDNGFDMSVDAKLGFSAEQKIEAGLVVSSLLFGFISKLGVHASFEHSLGWLSEASVTLATQRTMSKKIELFGAWEESRYRATSGGRMYVPNNMGYALVMSGTADLFALRVKGLGTLVSYAVAPNPDIPQDTNIIMFKLDPHYVKNGTLDGWVGYQPEDTAYPGLQAGQSASYFKPLEAYALKSQIEREHQQLLAYYEAFDAGSVGRRGNAGVGAEGFSGASAKGDVGSARSDLGNILIGAKDFNPTSDEQWKRQMARRSLVNTYVWNSDGGLYSEEEQFSAIREDSMGGSYDFTGKAGIYSEISMSIGLDFALDALFGGHIRARAMKTRRETTGFGLRCTAPGEGFLNRRSVDQSAPVAAGQYPIHFDAQSAPGKVNQYRFMSFYLAPKKRNFEDFMSVVDRNWLNTPGDPDALALKEALANPNEVWRVLHRVTYVNRVRESGVPRSETRTPDERRPDADSIASNELLIKTLAVTEDERARGVVMAVVGAKAEQLLTSIGLDNGGVSVSRAERARIKQNILAYMRGYYA